MKKDKISFSNNSHLSNSVVNIPEFVFNTEKLKVQNPKATDNIFESKKTMSPAIAADKIEKLNLKEKIVLNKNANSTIINHHNSNEVQNGKKVNALHLNANVGKINDRSVELMSSKKNLGAEKHDFNKGIFIYLIN